jgi:hypothetical protein
MNKKINVDFINKIEEAYSCQLTDDAKIAFSVCGEQSIFSDEIPGRVITRQEVLNGEVAGRTEAGFFFEHNLIPIIDVADNHIMVFDKEDNTWTLFYVIERYRFGKKYISFSEASDCLLKK